jgi:hypothetical protein
MTQSKRATSAAPTILSNKSELTDLTPRGDDVVTEPTRWAPGPRYPPGQQCNIAERPEERLERRRLPPLLLQRARQCRGACPPTPEEWVPEAITVLLICCQLAAVFPKWYKRLVTAAPGTAQVITIVLVYCLPPLLQRSGCQKR